MSYSKFGSIVNSEVTLDTVNEVVTFAVNENNKRIKLTSSGLDDVSSGYNLIPENPLSGPEMTLRSLVAGPGIQLSTLGAGDKLLVTNTHGGSGASGNSNTIHTGGTLSSITFGFLFNRGPSGSIEPEFLALPREINLKGVIDRTTTAPGVNWRFNQIGFDCALTIAPFALGQLSAGGAIQPSWALGFAEYDAGFGIFPVDYLFRLTIAGLPTVSKPVASHLNVQLGTFPITAYHVHTVSGTTGPPSSGGNHTHTYASYSLEKEMTTSLGVSIHSFNEDTGTMVLYLRNLSPNNLGIINLLSILLTSTFTLTWTADGAVDGPLNPDTSGSILAANGITASSNVASRTTALETANTDLTTALSVESATRLQADNGIVSSLQDFNVRILDLNTSKADLSYVNNQNTIQNNNTTTLLAGKANLAGATFTGPVVLTGTVSGTGFTTAIAVKADTTYVDTKNNAQDATIATKANSHDANFTGITTGINADMVGAYSILQTYSRYDVDTKNATQDATIAAKANSADVYLKTQTYSQAEADAKFALAGSGGTDLTNYYTKTETNNLLTTKANSSDLNNYYTKAQIDSTLSTTFNFATVIGWADNSGTRVQLPCSVTRVGNQVQLVVPSFSVNVGNVSRTVLASSSDTTNFPGSVAGIPSTYRPTFDTIVGTCIMTANAARTIGYLLIRSATGILEFYRDQSGQQWNTGTTGIGLFARTSSFTWFSGS